MSKKLLFIGECRSLTAKRKKWSWEDGRLAAKPLFEALQAMQVDPRAHEYTNLWLDTSPPIIAHDKFNWLRMKQEREGLVLVALGKRVSGELTKRSIDHVALVHPAARGRIRKRRRYHRHVADKLGPIMRKVVHVEFDDANSTYRFDVEVRGGGRRRVFPAGARLGEEFLVTSTKLEQWMRRRGITHVATKFDNHSTSRECIADGTYTAAKYVEWWAKAAQT